MGTNNGATRYRVLYQGLLQLYPAPFRRRFGSGMAQTFHDLCQEHSGASLFTFALGAFYETLAGIIRERTITMTPFGKTLSRVALGALVALMAPLIASQIVQGWNWPVAAFVVVYVLFFCVGMAFVLIARQMDARSYKAGVAIALVTAFALGWSTMVQTADSGHPERLWYLIALPVGLIGAFVARLRAPGLAVTLFAMAASLALASVIVPSTAPPELAPRMAIGHALCTVLFAASGLLFRRANLSSRESGLREVL